MTTRTDGKDVFPRPGTAVREPFVPGCASFRRAREEARGWFSTAKRLLWPAAALCALAALLVGSEVLQRHLFPDMSTGWRHATLTLRAAVVTAAGSAAVFFPMRRQQAKLSKTAEELTQLLDSCRLGHSAPARFENPHLVHCAKELGCTNEECAMFASPGDRCWQVVALNTNHHEEGGLATTIQQCRECEVYRRSCPDKLTELGESFNNLMFLLESEARQLGRMRSLLVEKEKMVAIGQMASGVAHEVGNPLSSISSIVQMLKRSKSEGPKTEQLDLIEKHIQRITKIVRQLVSLARPTAECWERLDVGEMLEEAVRLVGFDGRARNVDIKFERPTSLPITVGLRDQLQQVVINLALNALDAMPDGGTLTVDAVPTRRGVAIYVKDTGSGIPPEIGRRVFDPFFTTKEVGQGTGLGLSVSYGIVQKHEGTIDFQSVPGEGTGFTVFLPTLKRAPEENHGTTNGTAGRR